MASVLVLDGVNPFAVEEIFVTVAGTVVDKESNPLARQIFVFNDGSLSSPIGSTVSSSSTGAFSIQVPGAPTSKFTVVAVAGTPEENSLILSHCSEEA